MPQKNLKQNSADEIRKAVDHTRIHGFPDRIYLRLFSCLILLKRLRKNRVAASGGNSGDSCLCGGNRGHVGDLLLNRHHADIAVIQFLAAVFGVLMIS